MLGGVVIGMSGGEVGGSTSEQIIGGALSTIGAMTVAVYLVIGRRIRAQLDLTPYIWMVYVRLRSCWWQRYFLLVSRCLDTV